MNQDEFKKFREDILKGFQITATPTVKSILALFFSGLISTYGIYSILLSLGIEGNTMYKAIGIFVLILIVADTFKRGALARFYNSKIRNVIVDSKVLKMQLVVSALALSFMVVFDIVGSFSTANYVEAKYQEFQATSSKEFELLESNAKVGQSDQSLYSQELTIWQSDKKTAYQNCNDLWKGYKAKYKAKCKKEWDNDKKNAKPIKPNTNGSVSVDDYKSVKDDANSDFLSEYIFYIILFLSLALTMLLQYTTISEIDNKKDDIDQSLTSMVIGILQDRLTELETNMIQHETERNELISDADKKEKSLGRDFETRGKAIALLGLSKAVDARGKTVQRIANNEAMPTVNKKAGFVHNVFGDDEPLNEDRYNEQAQNSTQTNQSLNESVITKTVNEQNLVVKQIDLKEYNAWEIEIIGLLWKGATVKRTEQLETRDNVLKVIGNNKTKTVRLSKLYQKLLQDEFIYKKIGYFAKVEL